MAYKDMMIYLIKTICFLVFKKEFVVFNTFRISNEKDVKYYPRTKFLR